MSLTFLVFFGHYVYHSISIPGRLILDADTVPTVIPFVHTGMHEIMPIGAKFPTIGKTVGCPNSRMLVIYVVFRSDIIYVIFRSDIIYVNIYE